MILQSNSHKPLVSIFRGLPGNLLVFVLGLAVSVSDAIAQAQPAPCSPPPPHDECASRTGTKDGWWIAPSNNPALPITISSCRNGDPVKDNGWIQSVFSEYAPRMMSIMGPPKKDGGWWHDANIDAFVLNQGKAFAFDHDKCDYYRIQNANAHATNHSEPGSSASYMYLNRNMVGQDFMKRLIVHEFFHVLQNTHNTGCVSWITEASARAADFYFASRFANLGSAGTLAQEMTAFQSINGTGQSLDRILPGYPAFIWFYYLLQETGKPDLFKQLYLNIEIAPSCDKWTRAANQAAPFKTHFRNFALRNLNLDLQVSDPRYTLYNRGKWSLSDFPVGIPPQFTNRGKEELSAQKGSPKVIDVPVKMPALSANYLHYTPGKVKFVEFDFAGLPNYDKSEGFDYLIKLDGKWQLGQKKLKGGKLSLCRELKKEKFEELYLILNNASMDKDVSGTAHVTTRSDMCPGGLTGDIKVKFVLDTKNRMGTYHQEMDVAVTMRLKPPEKKQGSDVKSPDYWIDDGSTWQAKGTGTTQLTLPPEAEQMAARTGQCLPKTSSIDMSGSGNFDQINSSAPHTRHHGKNLILFMLDPDDPKSAWLHFHISRGMSGSGKNSCGKSQAVGDPSFSTFPCGNKRQVTIPTMSHWQGAWQAPDPNSAYVDWMIRGNVGEPNDDGSRTISFNCSSSNPIEDIKHENEVQKNSFQQEVTGQFDVKLDPDGK